MVVGILSFSTFIVFFIAISSAVVNHDGRSGTAPDLLSGLLVPFVSGVGWSMRFGIGRFCPGPWAFGVLSCFRFLHLPSALRTLLNGLILLVFWSSGYLS